MTENFIYCEIAEESFGKLKKPTSHYGDVSISYLTDSKTPQIVTGAREYQREKVASLSFRQGIMLTVILNSYKKIPEIHIRVVKKGKSFIFELIDGQQRITSILDFINGEFYLPKDDTFIINGIDLREKDINWIRENEPNLYQSILSYRITCKWYENLSDAQTADLFINVLNNSNEMKPQEKRNAIRGKLSEFIRNTARFEIHPLFSRIYSSNGKKRKYTLANFSEGFSISGRMEVDEFLSELIVLYYNGYRNGITQKIHTDWITKHQTKGGLLETEEQFEDFKESVLEPLLKFSNDVITSVPTTLQYKLVPMFSQMLILYGYELKNKYGQLIIETYVKKFFEVYDKWSNTTHKPYVNEVMWGTDDEQMEPFNKLFGGKNPKAIGTITYVLDKELKEDIDSFGVIETDSRDFTRDQIVRKWEEQGRVDYYDGHPLDIKKLVGDHYIPRMWGKKKGGVTEYDNLVVTSKAHNLRKLTMSGDEYKALLVKEELV